MSATPLLHAQGLSKRYRLPRRTLLSPAPEVQALDGVSFTLHKGRSLGVVGESGSGKSTLARLVMALEAPTSGQVQFEGRELVRLPAAELRRARADLQMVFQDPYGSLDPRRSVEQTVCDPLALLADPPRAAERRARAAEALSAVGLREADLGKYPHEFSGGQRQRVAIARCLTLNPEVLVLDEAVSALDVSVQAQVLNLLKDLQDEFGLSYVFISHDLAVVRFISDEVLVMKDGVVVEQASAAQILAAPREDYTKRLLAAIPRGYRAAA